jgi:hypothetical protein
MTSYIGRTTKFLLQTSIPRGLPNPFMWTPCCSLYVYNVWTSPHSIIGFVRAMSSPLPPPLAARAMLPPLPPPLTAKAKWPPHCRGVVGGQSGATRAHKVEPAMSTPSPRHPDPGAPSRTAGRWLPLAHAPLALCLSLSLTLPLPSPDPRTNRSRQTLCCWSDHFEPLLDMLLDPKKY